MRPDPPLSVVFTTAQALRAGMTRAQIEARVASGRWHRLRRGAFCTRARWQGADERGQHLLACRAVLVTQDCERLVLSHTSAAVAHGLEVPRRTLARVTVTAPSSGRRHPRRTPDVLLHVAGLPDRDLQDRDDLTVTTPARTVADCLRLLPREDGVALGDAALRHRVVTRADVEAVLAVQAGWPFAAVASSSLALVDPRRESGLESRSAVVMHRHDVPPPRLQVKILDARGRFVARVDFAWMDRGVVGEADGRVKYSGDAASVVQAEKDRQALLEALGLVVVRWDGRHLHGNPPPLVERLRTAFAAGDPSRFRGRTA